MPVSYKRYSFQGLRFSFHPVSTHNNVCEYDTQLKQPSHPSIISKLDPEYVTFHEKYIQNMTPRDQLPWDPIPMRMSIPLGKKPLDVGKIEEFELKGGGHRKMMRAYTPIGEPLKTSWPVLIYFHGGGWTLGGLDNEQSIITNFCMGARCVVLSVDYRLAPENKFPAAVDDAVEALQWVLMEGNNLLNADTSKIAVSGLSAGGNIAAALALKSAEESFTPLLPCPTSTTTLIYMYFLTEKDWLKWEASPLLAPRDLLVKAPKTWIGAGELDILCNEAEAYAERLRECGVDAECVVYKGGTHVNFMIDGTMMKSGEKGIADAVEVLAKAFGTAD
ncbi:Alpha/Beta hydrolase protein [Rhodocollybia butyracea]|uniref:Alpha/Beta hydrolase protein n=1 Tax=Rhodocollybia butyracea TaxID=206335 RepID=A0A9P5PTH9_9AGAR|nr:Alpha/Beta hydrolase protein [Rhodocollybia butyracea]